MCDQQLLEHGLKRSLGAHHNVATVLGCLLRSSEVEPLLRSVAADPSLKIGALCLLDAEEAGRAADVFGQIEILPFRRLDDFFAAFAADLIVISTAPGLIERETAFAVIDLALKGVAVATVEQFLASAEQARGPLPNPQIIQHLLTVVGSRRAGCWTKRALDILFAGVALIALAPLFAMIALAIKLESAGAVLFRQERLGQRRVPFCCFKFRTMRHDAERDTGPVWARADDPRITRVGRLLRKSRLDELPQLINVLRGEMSMVGTRPIRKVFADELAAQVAFYDVRFVDKPGLTGWAQIKYKYSASYSEQAEKFYYDYYYVKHQSFALDLCILALTAAVVVRMKGA